ncbi:hypothetical protein CFter6_2226 [Collimonas fungivorans]|uniref:Uncharacterized protein n=1 Tax=Collimonas fungivorans TaxID=158899 RepID=A0A127PBC8_9BURK|nr:hypothetical protein CFter6_2226 [Collimonas fungivorans]
MLSEFRAYCITKIFTNLAFDSSHFRQKSKKTGTTKKSTTGQEPHVLNHRQ